MAKFLPVRRSDLSVYLVLDSERDRTIRGLLSKVRGHQGLVLNSFASWRELRETVPSEGSVLVCGGHIALANEDLSYLRSATHNQNPIRVIGYVRPNNAEFRFVHSLGVARINCEVAVYGVDDVSLIELVLIDKAASPELAAVNGLGREIGLPDDVRGAFEKALAGSGNSDHVDSGNSGHLQLSGSGATLLADSVREGPDDRPAKNGARRALALVWLVFARQNI